MAVAIPPKEVAFPSDNIIVGLAEIKARRVDGVVQWELPGGEVTHSSHRARGVAEQMDRLIHVNVQRTGRSLLWS